MRPVLDISNIGPVRDEVKEGLLKAGKDAIRLATRQLEQDLEAQMRGAVRGNAWRAWTSEVYPKGDKLSYNPVGEVFGKGGKRTQGMLEYWSLPGTNRAKKSKYLAVPLRAAMGSSLKGDISPRQWEARFGAKLRPLFRPGKTPLLVADGAFGPGGFIKPDRAAAMRRGGQKVTKRMTIAVFALIEAQPHANRISIERAESRAQTRLAREFATRVARLS